MSGHSSSRLRRRGTTAGRGVVIAVVGAWVGAVAIATGLGRPQVLSRPEARARAEALASIGAAAFRDSALSASGRLSCASCHDPARAFGPPPEHSPIAHGGGDGRAPGIRAVPSLRYRQDVAPFTRHAFLYDDPADADQGPTGGLTWDGRVDRPRDQARAPLFVDFEMANASSDALAAAVRRARYADRLRRLATGDWQAAGTVVDTLTEALETYQQRADEFYPYTSRFDDVLRGRASLNDLETRGRAAFEDPARGNCARCHPSTIGADGTLPQFTDYSFVALGVPRNGAIPANADPSFVDLGLCGPLRTDLSDATALCGRFRTPSLRNVATRDTFFHNGAVRSLRDAVAFYATRDSSPDRWYPRGPDGRLRLFDDLPARFQGNVERQAPFGDPAPRLSDADIDAIVAFLRALDDADVAKRRPS